MKKFSFGLNQAKMSGGRAKFPEGRFRAKIKKVGGIESTNKKAKTQGDPVSVINFEVVEAVYQHAIEHKNPNGEIKRVPELQIPSAASWSMNMKNDAAAGNLKAFCIAAAGIAPTDAKAIRLASHNGKPVDWDEVYDFFASDDNPLLDTEIWIETKAVVTDAGYLFVIHDFMPVEGATVLFPPADEAAA